MKLLNFVGCVRLFVLCVVVEVGTCFSVIVDCMIDCFCVELVELSSVGLSVLCFVFECSFGVLLMED